MRGDEESRGEGKEEMRSGGWLGGGEFVEMLAEWAFRTISIQTTVHMHPVI